MARPESEEFQLYFSRIRPIYHQLFNLAHVITGNCEQAEYALQYAMLDCWSAGEASASHHGFRESLRSAVMHAAMKSASGSEPDWDGLRPDEQSTDPLLRAIAQESTETRRLLALHRGCGFSVRRIARITGTDANRIQTLLHRFEARTRRKLSAADRRKYDLLIIRAVRSQLSMPTNLAPDMGALFRTFQADAAGVSRPSHLPARIIRGVFTAVLAIILIAAFWLTAVLIQPPVMEERSPAAITETYE